MRGSRHINGATLGGVVLALLLDGCGSGSPPAGDAVACILQQDGATLCTEFVGLKSGDMRQAAGASCRESGGHTTARCPTQDLAGYCETANDVSQPWIYSRVTRRATYRGNRVDVDGARRTCAAAQDSHWIPVE